METADGFDAGLTPLGGGYSGETFAATSPDGEDLVVRIYQRNPERAVVDASLLRLVRGIVAVPEVVELRPATSETPAVLVTGRLPGVPLDAVLADPPRNLDWNGLGRNLGHLLARLSGIPFVRSGEFVGADLTIKVESMPSDLAAWAQHYRDTGRLAAWAERDWHGLLDLVDLADRVASGDDTTGAVDDRAVLVHSDFNPKNIVVEPTCGAVIGLVDWEFAYAGSGYADVGNFTRFERDPRLIEPIMDAFAELAPSWLDDTWEKGRAVDLWALIELAGRTRTNPVAELATTLLLAQSRATRLDAWPFDGDRVAP